MLAVRGPRPPEKRLQAEVSGGERPELRKRVSAEVKKGPPASSPLTPRVLSQETNDSLIA
jgi:hypothetical protein